MRTPRESTLLEKTLGVPHRLAVPRTSVGHGENWPTASVALYTSKLATGSKFINKESLLVSTLGKHYGGQLRVEEERSEAFEECVIGLKTWVPKSMIRCPT